MIRHAGKIHVSIKLGLIVLASIGVLLSYKLYQLYSLRTPHVIKTWQASNPQNKSEIDHSLWQVLLDKYVLVQADTQLNLFNYAAVSQADSKQLDRYIHELTQLDPREYARDEQLAYWINLYNAVTIKLVLDAYPVDSIRQVGNGIPGLGPWDDEVVEIAGEHLSLNHIEHGILRSNWQENRIHYGINCASIGCPNLSSEAFVGRKIEQQLQSAAIAFINHPRAVRLVDGTLRLSSIYDWFAVDFGDNESALLAHLKQFAKPNLKAMLDSYHGSIIYDYDWQLNRGNNAN